MSQYNISVSTPSSKTGDARFMSTRWSVVLAAAGHASRSKDSKEALATLCSNYWYPIYAFIRRHDRSAQDAQDLTQEFFLRFLEKDYLQLVKRERGRFRCYLLTALRHFLSDERERNRALKRGGGKKTFSLDFEDAEGRYRLEPASGLTPSQIFDRRWTLTVLARVLERIQREFKDAGKEKVFERLKDFLSGDGGSDSYAAAGKDLEMSEGAVRVAVHRIRKTYAKYLEEEIAETVADNTEIEDEIKQLFASLG